MLAQAAALLLALCATAQTPAPPPAPPPAPAEVLPFATIVAPPTVAAGSPIVLSVGSSASAAPFTWKLVAPKVPFEVYDQGGRKGVLCVIPAASPGTYRVALVAAGSAPGHFDFDFAEVAVASPGPSPPPGPGPSPGPSPPPGPTPPSPAPPGPIGNMRVILLYDQSGKLTRDQRAVLFSTTSVIPYLEAHCLKSADGRAEWRFWDRAVDTSGAPAEWRAAADLARSEPTPTPKLVVFAGNAIAGVRPITTEADALAFLQSLGGK